ncbi:MAG: hypothetical protein VKK04_08760 [Synechococcales bacterium]|nr:hypothetical protein [Synechococcales bacterium]
MGWMLAEGAIATHLKRSEGRSPPHEGIAVEHRLGCDYSFLDESKR